MNLLTKKMTPGERLLTWRRRASMTQTEAGECLDYCRTSYALMEIDRHEVRERDGRLFHPPIIPELLPHELLYLARRRSGMTLEEIGRRLGVSRPTVLKWEGRGDGGLRAWWRRRCP